jgi:hypothetical protein
MMRRKKMTTEWEYCQGKHEPYKELEGAFLEIEIEPDVALVTGKCPCCGGLLGIDMTYLEQVTNVIHCPLCCTELFVPDEVSDVRNFLACSGSGDGNYIRTAVSISDFFPCPSCRDSEEVLTEEN